MEIQTSAKPAVLWLRARQLCYLGGHAPQSGVIVGILQKLKDDMPADLADSQADEEHRKTDREAILHSKGERGSCHCDGDDRDETLARPSHRGRRRRATRRCSWCWTDSLDSTNILYSEGLSHRSANKQRPCFDSDSGCDVDLLS